MVNTVHIVYYVFVNHPHNWIGTVKGQIDDIIASGLLNGSASGNGNGNLHICLSGKQKLMEQAVDFINQQFKKPIPIIDYSFTVENLYEYPGIHKLYLLAKEYPEDLFIYLHTKSVSRSKSPTTRGDDNTYLTRFSLWNYSKINDIFNRYPDVNKIGLFPSGGGWVWFNFFWVRGNYLVNCQEPIISDRRHYYEDWLGTSRLSPTKNLDCYSLYNDKIGFNYRPYLACQLLRKLCTSTKFIILNSTVKQVTYGIDDTMRCHQVDVTQKFIELIDRNKHLTVSNSISSIDPYFGVRKKLTIKLTDGQKIELLEGDTILVNTLSLNVDKT